MQTSSSADDQAQSQLEPPTTAEAALAYARRGWRIIPLHGIVGGKCTCQRGHECQAPGKHPIWPRWPERATSDVAEISSWKLAWHYHNLGIATGAESGIIVLDIDPRHGGDDSLEQLISEHGTLPDTLQAVTGGGGRHYYFRHPGSTINNVFRHPGGSIKNVVGLRPGIDLRADGGMVVAPPSLHISGRRYDWDGLDGFADEVAPAPHWLIEIISKTEQSARKHSLSPDSAIPEGQRNTELMRIAGAMRRRGCTPAEIETALRAVNEGRCRPPLPLDEVRSIARSVGRYEPAILPDRDWAASLICTQHGTPRALLANAITALEQCPDWDGVLGYDSFALRTMMLRRPPWMPSSAELQLPAEWTTAHDIRTAEWMQRQGICVSADIAGQAVEAVSAEHPYHPVRAWLDSLTWDGVARLEKWLITYCGAEDTDLTRAVGAKWLISAIARIYSPGCKADSCLILEGSQGIGKSRALAVLGGQWYTDELADLGGDGKDASMQTAGIWIIELAELDAVSRAEASRIKAFLSRSVDRYRPPYARRVVEVPRQCVFAGTVNHDSYLRDETGARRFWPVSCGQSIDIDGLSRDREQIWAEAAYLYWEGRSWWLDDADLIQAAASEQEARYDDDPWAEIVHGWIEGRDDISIQEILEHCLEIRPEHWSQLQRNRVARILRRAGWIRYYARDGKRREWRYRR